MTASGYEALAALLRQPALARLLDTLNGEGEETRVVGGAVRNALLGRPVQDVDLATTATPDVVSARAARAGFGVVPTGIEHGTVTVVIDGAPFEVTTLREDVATDGRHAVVRFGRDFGRDAERRDFTINALSATRDGRVHDAVGGLADLGLRRVRFIGDPDARIREDYLRILRFFRFSADYGEGPLDPDGLAGAIRGRDGVAVLSRERIRAEFLKLLAARRAVEVAGVVSDTGFLALFLGGVGDLGRLARAVAHDAAEGRGPDPVLRLGALAVATEEDAERLRERLRLSNAEHERLAATARVVARFKSLSGPLDPADIRMLASEPGVLRVADALAIVKGEPRPILTAEAREIFRRLVSGEEAAPVFPFGGKDLIARGVPSGRRMGELLAKARAAWLAAGCPAEASLDDLLKPQGS